MEYMILLYSDESATPDFQPGSAEFDEMMGAWMAFNDELGAAGQLVSGASLQPTATATVVGKSGDGSFTITDGPYAETKEQIGGYYLVNVDNLDAAIEIAKKVPLVGRFEIRPIAFNPASEQG